MSIAHRRDATGMLVKCEQGEGYFAKAHAALVAGVPYLVNDSYESVTVEGVAANNAVAVTAACAAEASIYKRWGVALKAYAPGDIAFLLNKGECDMLVNGDTDVGVGDTLKIAPGGSATCAIKSGTTETESTVAVALVAYTTAAEALKRVSLMGGKRIINT